MKGLRIAMLVHSTNPRGGVAHGMALCEALAALGHAPCLFAPDVAGVGFFRDAACEMRPLPAAPAPRGLAAMVRQRVGEYKAHFTPDICARFDLFHAQDSISANALADLRETGRISGFCRTVHHLDEFADPELARLQARGVAAAARLFAVSREGCAAVRQGFRREAVCVGNGVDMTMFSPLADARDAALRGRLGLAGGPVILSLGGVEPRKNTLALLEAFVMLRRRMQDAVLLIAGGATLLDHGAYRARFDKALAQSGLPEHAVRVLGRLSQAEMPALYRLADMLAFPSLREGFGLAVLEAMASGLKVLVPRQAPFTEYLAEEDAAWCEAAEPASIAGGMLRALADAALPQRGLAVAQGWGWRNVARAHLPIYEMMGSREHA